MEGGAAAGRGRHRLTACVPDVRVFISYASVDHALAESVDDILARSAVEVWRDRTRLDWLLVADLSRDGNVILAGGQQGTLFRFDNVRRRAVPYGRPPGPRRRLRVGSGGDAGEVVFPLASGAAGTAITCLTQNADGSVALVGRCDGRPVVVDHRTGDAVELPHGRHRVVTAALSDDGSVAVTGTDTGLICVWRCATRELLALLRMDDAASRVLLRGRQLVVGSSTGRLLVFDVRYGPLAPDSARRQ